MGRWLERLDGKIGMQSEPVTKVGDAMLGAEIRAHIAARRAQIAAQTIMRLPNRVLCHSAHAGMKRTI